MISDKLGQELHDRSTRGKQLTNEEQLQLESWYEYHDALENEAIGAISSETTIVKLQNQIETTLTQIKMVTQQIQKIAAENKKLRQEIQKLSYQLANLSPVRQVA